MGRKTRIYSLDRKNKHSCIKYGSKFFWLKCKRKKFKRNPSLYADITGQLGCGHRAKFSPSVGVGGGPKGEIHPTVAGRGKRLLKIANSSYSRYQIPSSSSGWASSDNLNGLFPSNTFLPRTYNFFQISQPGKNLTERKDILRNRSIGCPYICLICCFVSVFCKWLEKEQCRKEYLTENLALIHLMCEVSIVKPPVLNDHLIHAKI